MVFNFFALFRKILFKFLLASMKTLTYSGDFTGSQIKISPPFPPPPQTRLAAMQRELRISFPPLKKR